jgi:hypothetical protein
VAQIQAESNERLARVEAFMARATNTSSPQTAEQKD